MDFDYLPKNYILALQKTNTDKLSEIRLRKDFPVRCKYFFKKCYLGDNGITLFEDGSIMCTEEDIRYIINKVTEFSVYAFNDRIKQGFITIGNGVRIGLAGECVREKDEIITIKNISSLNIRIPHEVIGCSKKIFKYIYEDDVINNVLIVSPPAFGKTTLLKDIARNINEKFDYSILILDERGEFENIKGDNIDKISYSDKLYGFNYGIRTLSPDIVITDELSSETDWECVKNAVNSGVKIMASCHGKCVTDLNEKKGFSSNYFDRIIVLENSGVPGLIKGVYDKDMNCL